MICNLLRMLEILFPPYTVKLGEISILGKYFIVKLSVLNNVLT